MIQRTRARLLRVAAPLACAPLALAGARCLADFVSQPDSGTAPGSLASVVVTPESAWLAALGATQEFYAQGRDTRGDTLAGLAFTWTTSDSSVATVDGAGVATARGNGTVTIRAGSDEAWGTATLTIEQITASVATVPDAPVTLASLGDRTTFTAQARDANGFPIAGKRVVWSSDAPAVATIDPETGVATAVGNGTATIRAAVDGVTGTATLVVRQAVSAVTVTPSSFSLGLGESRRLTATARDANGNPVTRPVTFTWESDNPLAVTVEPDSEDGATATATRILTGAATITATTEGKSGYSTVT